MYPRRHGVELLLLRRRLTHRLCRFWEPSGAPSIAAIAVAGPARADDIVQQAAIVLLLLGLYHFVIFWIDGLTGHGYTAWVRWLPVLSGALLWPLVVALGDSVTRRSA